MTTQIISQFARNPKKLFLVDAIGAFISGILLFTISKSNLNLGLADSSLEFLILIAFCLFVYSLTCFLYVRKNIGLFIRTMAFTNFLYCALTIGILLSNSNLLTRIGWTYFSVELIIIGLLIVFELRIARELKCKN